MINGYIPAARFLPFLSWTDVAALPDKSNTVIVPTGAIEQHGSASALLGGQRDIFRRGGHARQAAGDDPGLRHPADRLR